MEPGNKTQAQSLTELVMSRKIKKTKGFVPDKFWSLPEWKPEYKRQIMAANSLLKIFEYSVIVEALNTKECNWIFSLATKNLIPVCQQIAKKRATLSLIKEQQEKTLVVDENNINAIPVSKKRKNIKDMLND